MIWREVKCVTLFDVVDINIWRQKEFEIYSMGKRKIMAMNLSKSCFTMETFSFLKIGQSESSTNEKRRKMKTSPDPDERLRSAESQKTR